MNATKWLGIAGISRSAVKTWISSSNSIIRKTVSAITVSKSLSEISGRFELVTPKSGKVRVLPSLNVLEKELEPLCLATPECGPNFKYQKGGYLRHSNFMKRVFAPALANVHQITFHELRDTAISQAIASGADVLAITELRDMPNRQSR
jgi:hypothetical protein